MSYKPHILIALSHCQRAVERAKTHPEYDRNKNYRLSVDDLDDIFLPWMTRSGGNEKLICEMLERCVRDLQKPFLGHEGLRNSSEK